MQEAMQFVGLNFIDKGCYGIMSVGWKFNFIYFQSA